LSQTERHAYEIFMFYDRLQWGKTPSASVIVFHVIPEICHKHVQSIPSR